MQPIAHKQSELTSPARKQTEIIKSTNKLKNFTMVALWQETHWCKANRRIRHQWMLVNKSYNNEDTNGELLWVPAWVLGACRRARTSD